MTGEVSEGVARATEALLRKQTDAAGGTGDPRQVCQGSAGRQRRQLDRLFAMRIVREIAMAMTYETRMAWQNRLLLLPAVVLLACFIDPSRGGDIYQLHQ